MPKIPDLAPRFLLALAAFAPLFAVWTVRTIGLPPAWVWLVSLALATLPVAFWLRRFWVSGKGGAVIDIDLDLDAIEGGAEKSIALSYHLMAQMAVAVAATITPRSTISVVILVLAVAVMQIRLRLEMLNPVATLFGRWIYLVREKGTGKEFLVISRFGRLGKGITARKLAAGVFIESPL